MVEEVKESGGEAGEEKEAGAEVEGQQATVEALASELAALRGEVAEVGRIKEQLADAVGKYRALVLAGAPEVPEELVQGATVEEVDVSFNAARNMVDKVRRQLEASLAVERVPAGAPPRTPPDLSALSPREKIAYALARQQG